MSNKQLLIDINNCGFVDPQMQLGAAIANGDLREFRLALDSGAEPMLYDDRHTNVFETALKTHGRSVFVEECLRHGCNPNNINKHFNKAAINFAVDSRDPKVLAALLKQEDINVNRKYAELTPLNALAKNLTADNASDVSSCMKLLLNYGASPNIPDQREMTPMLYVLKNRKLDDNRKRELVQMLLAQKNLDIDSHRDGEARTILTQAYPDLQLPPQNMQADDVNFECLLTDLKCCDEAKFLQHFQDYQLNISEKDNLHNSTQEENIELLLMSIKLGQHEAFDVLLQACANINAIHNGNTAVGTAAAWGNWYALKVLLAHEDLNIRKKDQLLITVLRKLDYAPRHDYTDYQKCFDILLDSELININETDDSGTTALHYAVQDRNSIAAQELLKRGAYIGVRSDFGDLPIEYMQPDLLAQHFDSCISTNGLKCGDDSYEIIMNYKNLMPPADDQLAKRYMSGEMAPIAFFADSKEHLHLLQHPLITSFLFLKWHRLSVVFYVNFFLYSLFAISIVTHTILKFRASENEVVTQLFGLFSWIGIAYLVLRETIQFMMAPTKYFRSIINYLEIVLIILAIMTCSEPSYDQETQRVIAVFTMLLVSLELCLLVGSLPVLSISTHMLMLRAVSKSFLKSFTLYSIFVITFSLCFYILFGKPALDENGQPKNNEDGEFNKFSNPLVAVIKTIVMLTGEFDAGDIDFDTLYSYLLFLLFVVFMSIVLFNLLNGLAVSDTQVIKVQAELNGSICRANLLTRYEEVLTGRTGRATFIVNHEPFRTICGRLMNLYPNYLAGRQISILPNDNNKVMIPVSNAYEMQQLNLKTAATVTKTTTTTTAATTGNGLRSMKSAAFSPLPDNDNEKQKKLLDPPVRFLPCCCSCFTGKCAVMDSRTVKLAMAVIEQKTTVQRERQRLQGTERRLQGIEQKLLQMFELLREIQAK